MKPLIIAIILVAGVCRAGEAFDYHSVRGRYPAFVTAERIEAEHMYYQKPGRVQYMDKYGDAWSGQSHVLWEGATGDSLKFVFTIKETRNYRLALKLTAAPDYGIAEIRINDKVVAEDVDTYSNRVEILTDLSLGNHYLIKGKHRLSLTLTGANAKSKPNKSGIQKGYLFGVDYLETARLDKSKAKDIQTPVLESREVSKIDQVSHYSFTEMKSAFSEHCYRCHGSQKEKGDVNLEDLKSVGEFLASIDLTRQITESIEFREMPPEDEPQLDDETHSRMLATLNYWLANYIETENHLPAVTMRRMNRFEYSNSVRDLLQLRGDIYPMPEKAIRSEVPYFLPKTGHFPESLKLGNRPLGKRQVEEAYLTGVQPFAIDLQAAHGFNNRGDELSMSPILMESFLKLSDSIVNAPEFDRYCKITSSLFKITSEVSAEEKVAVGRDRLRELIVKAFRSPFDEAGQRYLDFFEREFLKHEDFTKAMKKTTSGILASPRFLYLVEMQTNESAVPLSAYELASRLSFFLWSTIPDDELLTAADSGGLLTDAGLRSQVTRMLESPKSQALSQNFARQWMRLDGLINAIPDYDRFKHYYSRFGCEQFKFGLHAMAEPLLLFESIMVEDRSIMLLVDSRYAWRTEALNTWYSDIKTPFTGKGENRFETYQSVYQKVPLKTRRDGGIMTTAAMLTMTSDPLRTNPINRGSWALGVMFNQPPPPPPDAVPEIEADDAAIEAKGLTLRQRLKQHQENESCASCHSKIDPLGFAFENFDAVGRWREKYKSGLPIDASGDLFGEGQFTNIEEFKSAVLSRPEWFMRGFSEHLLSYALGRELEISDRPAVDGILQESISAKGRFTTIVNAITQSYPFRHKSQTRTRHDTKE